VIVSSILCCTGLWPVSPEAEKRRAGPTLAL